jgi:hypothetical protein
VIHPFNDYLLVPEIIQFGTPAQLPICHYLEKRKMHSFAVPKSQLQKSTLISPSSKRKGEKKGKVRKKRRREENGQAHLHRHGGPAR